jgi:integrase
MARPELMTWIPGRRGWMKEYKGKKYAVSCRQLGAPETKEASRQQANAWWTAKKAELDARPRAKAQVSLEDIAVAVLGKKQGETLELRDMLRLLRVRNAEREREEERREKARELYEIDELPPEEPDAGRRELSKYVALQLVEYLLEEGTIPEEVARHLPASRVAQLEGSVKGLRGESDAPPERTVKAQFDRWVETQQARVRAGSLSPDHADVRRVCLGYFASFLGESADVAVVNAERLGGFYVWCLGKVEERKKDPAGKAGWSVDHAGGVFKTARAFARFLWESDLIELPRNINSKAFRFKAGRKAIQTWTPAEVRWVIGEAPGQLKLHLLLMLNCGLTQGEISELRDEEVDWKEGRINHKRVKTGDWKDVPTVGYRLWPSTFGLLKKYRSRGERVLLTESGRPFVRKELKGGRLSKSDTIASNYKHLKDRLGFKKPMKQLRKTAASLIESHETYGRLTSLFLGHSPRSMKDKHYATPPQELLDAGVLWLGERLGLLDPEG